MMRKIYSDMFEGCFFGKWGRGVEVEVIVCLLLLKDCQGRSVLFSATHLAVAMKKASFLLCLSRPEPGHKHPLLKHPTLKQQPLPPTPQLLSRETSPGTLVRKGTVCRGLSVAVRFITSTCGGQIRLIFNISYVLENRAVRAVQEGQQADLTAGFKDKQPGSSHCPT